MRAEQQHGVEFQDEAAHAAMDSAWSALVDGELTSEQCDALLKAVGDESQPYASWQSYQLIGDVLRGERVGPAQAPRDFLAGVRAGLARPDEAIKPVPRLPVVSPGVPIVRGEAANEAVWRWKWVAGLASVAAVAAVSWSLGSQMGATGNVPPGPLLVQSPGSNGVVVAGTPAGRPVAGGLVVVNTGQGPLLRDPGLERMLAEHRQYGSLSALQMPAGFLRSATYDNQPGE